MRRADSALIVVAKQSATEVDSDFFSRASASGKIGREYMDIGPASAITAGSSACAAGPKQLYAFIVAVAVLAGGCAPEKQKDLLPSNAGDELRHAVPTGQFITPSPEYRAAVTLPHKNTSVLVGERGSILRYTADDDRWLVLEPTRQDLYGVTAGASDTLIAVGSRGTILRSTDNGTRWESAAESGTSETLLYIIPVGPSSYVAMGRRGVIVRSNDDGQHWRPVNKTGSFSGLISACITPSGTVVAVGVEGSIVYSRDRGEEWSTTEESPTSEHFHTVVCDRKGTVVANDRTGKLFRSTNGSQWQTVGGWQEKNDRAAHVTVTADDHFVAVGPDGLILRSRDAGRTWQRAANSDTKAHLWHVTAAAEQMIAVGKSGAVVHSVDGGANWQAVKTATQLDLSNVEIVGGGALAFGNGGTIVHAKRGGPWMRKRAASLRRALYDVVAGDKVVRLAVGERGSILRSTDSGATWRRIKSGTDEDLHHLLLGPNKSLIAVGISGHIARSFDSGQTWATVAPPEDITELAAVAIAPNDSMIAVGYGGLVLRAQLAGKSWTTIKHGVTARNLLAVGVADSTVVAVGEFGTIIRSTDAGRTWVSIKDTGTTETLNHVTFGSAGLIVAVGDNRTIVRSHDRGATWTRAKEVPPDRERPPEATGDGSLSFIINAANDVLIAVGSYGTILRSTDAGMRWEAVGTRDRENDLGYVASTTEDTLIALGTQSLLRSTNAGRQWSVIAANLNYELHRLLPDGTGTYLGVGEEGAIFRLGPPYKRVPNLTKLTASYSASGQPVLHFALSDPEGLCSNLSCLSIAARSQADHETGVAPRILRATDIRRASDGTYSLQVDPARLNARSPDPIRVRFTLSGDGYQRVFPEASGEFEVPNAPNPFYAREAFQIGAALLGLTAIFLLTLFFKPQLLIPLVLSPGAVETGTRVGIPGTGIVLGFLRWVLIPLVAGQPRLLDAWTLKHQAALRRHFTSTAQRTTERYRVYYPLPLEGPNGELITPSPQALRHLFADGRTAVQIIGQGGAGKTRLAIQIAAWVFDGELQSNPAAVIFVDEEFDDLSTLLHGKLKESLDGAEIPAQFLQGLLRSKRLWVIVDRLSERQPTTRSAVEKVYRSLPVNALIITSRQPVRLSAHTAVTLKPRPLDGSTLLSFLGEQLRQSEAGELVKTIADQGRLVQRLAQLITVGNVELRVTPLLVRMFVAKAAAIAKQRGTAALDELPTNVPDAYFDYVEQLDAAHRDEDLRRGIDPALCRHAAALIAFLELGDDFRPKPISIAHVTSALSAESQLVTAGVDYLRRFEESGLLARYVIGAEARVEYVLDPLAECLAAYEHARRCGSDAGKWTALLERARSVGESGSGFMLALRIVHAAYGKSLGFPSVSFPEYQLGRMDPLAKA